MQTKAAKTVATTAMPRPPYLTDEWLHAHGVKDVGALLKNLRPEDSVMKPEILRAVKATRFSFARNLIARMTRERWHIWLAHMEMDAHGVGRFVYGINANGHEMQFGVFAMPATKDERPGRVADDGFDFYGALVEGPVNLPLMWEQVARFKPNYQGRTDNQCYGWTAINLSNRFFEHVVERLAEGKQPDLDYLATGGGYIVRNAGWMGNGRFGTRSFLAFKPDHPLSYPYHIDMFALYLERVVGFDAAEAIAKARNPDKAVKLDPKLKRVLGIGNSSGIGMVAALVRWPTWMSAYNFPRELTLAYAKTQAGADPERTRHLHKLLLRCAAYYDEQPACPVPEIGDPKDMAAGLRAIAKFAEELATKGTVDGVTPSYPWAAIAERAAQYGYREVEEQVYALMLDLFPDFADAAAELFPLGMKLMRQLDPDMTVGALFGFVETRYGWALEIDQSTPQSRAHFWYRSELAGENRRGDRGIDAGDENETFVDVVGLIHALYRDLKPQPAHMSASRFLLEFPQHSFAVSRVQTAAKLPYTEIRGNIIGHDFLPMDGIRFLLSTMGLECSHPNNTRWVRGVFIQGAPTPEDIHAGRMEDWIFPTLRSPSPTPNAVA